MFGLGKGAPGYTEFVMPTRKAGRDDVDQTEDRLFTKDPSRVIAISDGVFAVALTLLVLDVKLPTVSQPLLASAIWATAPRLGIFALSFAIVAYYWVSHQFSFGYVRLIDRGLLWLNMLFLFTIVVLPFSAAVLADYPLAAPAITLYGTNVAACSATLAICWWYAVRKRLSIDVSRDERRRVAVRTMISPALAVIGIAVATIAPVASLVLFVAIPVASYAIRPTR
jgi:TMEM175 potassium channel family protein